MTLRNILLVSFFSRRREEQKWYLIFSLDRMVDLLIASYIGEAESNYKNLLSASPI